MEYRPSIFSTLLPFILSNGCVLYLTVAVNGKSIDKLIIAFFLLNIFAFLFSKNKMNQFLLTETKLVINNYWRFSFYDEIELSKIKKVGSRLENYDDFIVLYMKDGRTKQYSTRRLTEAVKNSLMVEINKKIAIASVPS